MKEKKYILYVYNTCSHHYEFTKVEEIVFNTMRRSGWNEEKNNTKHAKNTTPFSSLKGGTNSAFENFHEFISEEQNPEKIIARLMELNELVKAIEKLDQSEQKLIQELYVNEKSEHYLSSETGIPRMTICNRKNRILEKLRKILEK